MLFFPISEFMINDGLNFNLAQDLIDFVSKLFFLIYLLFCIKIYFRNTTFIY